MTSTELFFFLTGQQHYKNGLLQYDALLYIKLPNSSLYKVF